MALQALSSHAMKPLIFCNKVSKKNFLLKGGQSYKTS